MDSTFNIISFDGGGIRGALSIKLLEKIKTLNPNIVKNANSLAPILPGVGAGDITIYKNTCRVNKVK